MIKVELGLSMEDVLGASRVEPDRLLVKMARFALGLFVATIPATPSLAQDAAAAREECSAGGSHVEMRSCLLAKEDASASELRNAKEQMRKALRAWDQEPVYRKRSASEFDASVKQFGRYRQQQCELVASLAAGGNSQQDLRLSCLYEMNTKRTQQVQRIRSLVQ